MNKILFLIYLPLFFFFACGKETQDTNNFEYTITQNNDTIKEFSNYKSKLPGAYKFSKKTNNSTLIPENRNKNSNLKNNQTLQLNPVNTDTIEGFKTKIINKKTLTLNPNINKQNKLTVDEPSINKIEEKKLTTDKQEYKIAPLLSNARAHNKRTNSKNIVLKNEKVTLSQSENNIKSKKSLRKQTNKYATSNNQIKIKVLKKQETYNTNKNYTLLVEILNTGKTIENLRLDPVFPNDWKLITTNNIESIKTNEKKLVLVSFYIPANSAAGNIDTKLLVKNKNNFIVQESNITINVANNYSLELFNVNAPQQLQAGELIKTTFAIKNEGNIDQNIILSSKNKIEGKTNIIILKDSTVIVELSQKTDSRSNFFRNIGTNLEVYSETSGLTYNAYKSVEVIPTKIKQKDPFFRYPIMASLFYSSYTNKNEHYSTLSAELRGNGFLDLNRDHHLNFIIRGPKKEDFRRFNIADQYSLIYRNKDKTTIHLGDHSYFINKLGFGSRYGMGFKVDHKINKWTLSAFYNKPRLYSYNLKSRYGVKGSYNVSDSLNLGLTIERSSGNQYNYGYNPNRQNDEKGQIATFDYNYKNKNTIINAEISTSITNKTTDFANDFNLTQSFKNFNYNGNFVLAGKNYFGNITNSLQLTNNINYNNTKLNLGIGHAVSRINRRLDPLLYSAEPFYENYFATLGYRFENKHYLSFRFDKREREDQLDPKDFHYKEYGMNYNFTYTDRLFTGSFGGRFAKTQNLLIENKDYRNTYSNNLNVSYKIFKRFNIRGGLIYNYTNRYGNTNANTNYIRYNFGFNYSLNRYFRINANYNSGFSPEETYKKREYINLNMTAQINKHHRFEIRANYFENPGARSKKELLAYVKYTHCFGIGLKRILEQGGVIGNIYSNDNSINTKGIKIYTAGKAIVTNKNGAFELNNLPLGVNHLFIDESTLPDNVVARTKNPIEVTITQDKKTIISLELLKSGNLKGTLSVNGKNKSSNTNLEGYVKLENKNFTYYSQSSREGYFKFENIVPGEYIFNVIRFKNKPETFTVIKNTNITVKNEIVTELNISVNKKERKIKFKNTNFNVETK